MNYDCWKLWKLKLDDFFHLFDASVGIVAKAGSLTLHNCKDRDKLEDSTKVLKFLRIHRGEKVVERCFLHCCSWSWWWIDEHFEFMYLFFVRLQVRKNSALHGMSSVEKLQKKLNSYEKGDSTDVDETTWKWLNKFLFIIMFVSLCSLRFNNIR